MSVLSDFAVETPPANLEQDMDIIPDEDTEENRKKKIRRLLEQPHALIKMVRDNPVAQLMARNHPATSQPESE
eukprot:171519-Karenia_brevis.AAC.1